MCQKSCVGGCVPCRKAKIDAKDAKIVEQEREINRLRAIIAQKPPSKPFLERLTYLFTGQ